jgi:hypothetical protein
MSVLTPTGVKHDALGHLVLVDHPPDAHADLIRILQAGIGHYLLHPRELRAGHLR